MPSQHRACPEVIVSVCILAKNEGKVIGNCLTQLSRQSFVSNGTYDVQIHVVANGCTDDTVGVALSSQGIFSGSSVKLHVHDLYLGGKSRSWNRAVHELADVSTDIFVFIDADITFVDNAVVAEMLACLQADSSLAACSGFPVKDVSTKSKKKILDRASLIVSERSRRSGLINGSLYVARAQVLRETWLPDQTPGEDGFLNAMLTTLGFTEPPSFTVVTTPARPTHFFHSHGPLEFVTHERRMIVGTMINRWIFEHLWSLNLPSPAGPLIRHWNETDPGWVESLVKQRIENRNWLIPNTVLFGRFTNNVTQPWWKRLAYIPLAAAATLLTVPPAILANKRLKEFGAATTW